MYKNEFCSYQVLVEVFAWYLFMSLVVEVSHSFSTLNIVKTKFNLTPPEFQQPKDRKFDLPLWRFEYPPYKRPKAIPNNVQDIIVSVKEFTKLWCTLHNDKVYDNISQTFSNALDWRRRFFWCLSFVPNSFEVKHSFEKLWIYFYP